MRSEVIIGKERIIRNFKKHFKMMIVIVFIGIIISLFMAISSKKEVTLGEQESDTKLKGTSVLIQVEWSNQVSADVELEKAQENMKEIIAVGNSSQVLEAINAALENKEYEKLSTDEVISCSAVSAEMIEIIVYSYESKERILFVADTLTEVVQNIVTNRYKALSCDVVVQPVVQDAQLTAYGYELIKDVYEEDSIDTDVGTEQTFMDKLISKETILLIMVSIIVAICYFALKVFFDNNIYIKEDLSNYKDLLYIGTIDNQRASKEETTALIISKTKHECANKNLFLSIGNTSAEVIEIMELVNNKIETSQKNDCDNDLLNVVSDSDAMVLFIKIGEVKLGDLDRLISKFEVMNANVLGFVLVK